MKKIGGKSFWIILVLSITSLFLLIVGVIFLTKKSETEFYSSGYIISSGATKTDRYYFNDNTTYKENVFEEYIFKDMQNNEVHISKDNFIHYLDNSMSFMQNGVILDLDNLDTSLVPYYNITDKSLLKYNNGSYYIENSDKTLIFTNFLGRISENKYIVVGSNIKVKLAGNDNPVSGDYFEVLFVENGIVKIENQEGSYQTVSDGTIIYIGDNIKIDLGTQKVISNNTEKLSLQEMTINGDDNIDIKDETGKIDKDNTSETGESAEKDANISDTENNNTTGNDTEEETTSVLKKEVSINLITAEAKINSLSASFQIIDTANFIKGNLIFNLVNTTTGKTVYTKTLANVPDIQNVSVSSLSPDCNYVMTITEENNSTSTEYFKKVFQTESLDLKLIRDLATTNSLSYTLNFGESSEVKSANVSLYDENGQVGATHTIINGEDNTINFSSLEKNKKYNVVVDSVIFNNTNYAETYTINRSDMTLKEKPILNEISVSTDTENQNFTLKMELPEDVDKSITRYTYEIYKAEDLTEENINSAKPVYTYSQNDLKDVTLSLGIDGLEEKTDYRFKVIVEYYDNYKYGTLETNFSDYFQVVGKPTITFEEETVDFNLIKGKIILKDEGCLVPFEGRECNDNSNDIIVRYRSALETSTKAIKSAFIQNSKNKNEYYMSLELNNLIENTNYIFEVYSDIDLKNGSGLKESQYIGGFTVKTKGIESLKMQNWHQNTSTYNTPISVNTELVSTVPESNYGDKLASLTFKLYRGDITNGIKAEPIIVFKDTEDIKGKYYNKEFSVTSNMLGINNLDELRELSGGKLSRYYTIEVTDAYDASETNKFNIIDNLFVFETPAILLLEDEVESPSIIVEELTNIQMKSGEYTKKYDPNLSDSIIVGYQVIASFNKEKIETYFQGENPIKTINFHISKDGKEVALSEGAKTINLANDNTYTKYFFLDYGSDYNTEDDTLRRGNTYVFSYDISIDTNNDGKSDTVFPSNRPVSGKMTSIKQDPTFKMYIDNSTASSVTYKYQITDYDNALYKSNEEDNYYIYYTIDGDDNEYQSIITKREDYNIVEISNLVPSALYSLNYYRASSKRESDISKVNIGKYLFDGIHESPLLEYKLDYGNFDNRLKVIIEDNDFLNRVSAYRLVLSSDDTNDKDYELILSSINESSECDDKKCIIIDYSNIQQFKGNNVKVSLEAFYDTGLIGFSQESKLGNYFKSLGYVDDKNLSKVGYVLQNTSTTEIGKYVYLNSNGGLETSNTPKGILGYSLTPGEGTNLWKLKVVNLVNINENKFVSFDTIAKEISVYPVTKGIFETSTSTTRNTFNPKVLDKVNLNAGDNNFKFTSITPKVKSEVTPLINGGVVDIDLSIDSSTLESDFVKTDDDKYKFYIDIYTKNECSIKDQNCSSELVYLKSIETDYDNLTGITFEGLDPDTTYYYKISADMNKNGTSVKTPLFDYNRSGYIEYQNSFKTLGKDEIFTRVTYNYDSKITEETYSKRTLNIISYLNTNKNFNIKYELYDNLGNLEYESTINNNDITTSGSKYLAKYSEDITGNTFVFGENYHTLKIYAVTTDLGKELELYNKVLTNGGLGEQQDIGELINPSFNISQTSIINNDEGSNNYGIKYEINVKDEDKVINNGIYNIELQNASYENACTGHEEDCKATVDIKNSTCTINGSSKNCTIVSQDQNGNQVLNITFNDLKPNTNYIIYVYANTYRNNLSLDEKEGLVYVRKSQYTKSELGFSLGAVTPTAVSKNKLVITFTGASNLENKLKKIDYNITVIGAEKIAEGTLEIGKNINFGRDKDNYPTLEIPIANGNELGLNNYIILTYYYETDDGSIEVLMFGEDTNMQYPVKSENK
ncbi:MAG: hypothetical protein ACI31S_01240 [Bacilli bacterium]